MVLTHVFVRGEYGTLVHLRLVLGNMELTHALKTGEASPHKEKISVNTSVSFLDITVVFTLIKDVSSCPLKQRFLFEYLKYESIPAENTSTPSEVFIMIPVACRDSLHNEDQEIRLLLQYCYKTWTLKIRGIVVTIFS